MESPAPRDKATYAGETASKRSSSTSGLTNDQYILKQLKSINDSVSSNIVVGTIMTVDIGLGISVVEPPDWSRRGSAFDSQSSHMFVIYIHMPIFPFLLHI